MSQREQHLRGEHSRMCATTPTCSRCLWGRGGGPAVGVSGEGRGPAVGVSVGSGLSSRQLQVLINSFKPLQLIIPWLETVVG